MTARPRVVLATRNAHKVPEIRQVLDAAGMEIDLVDLHQFPDVADVVESGLTFTQNALLKANAVAAATGLPALADDSGISVDALNGMPGVFSGRWAGRHGDDLANLELLLAQLDDVPDEHRGAAFVCVAALVVPAPVVGGTGGTTEVTEEGRVEGTVIRVPRGANGFGYDPVFVPDGHTRTTAELSPEEKNALSHRGRAFRAIAPALSATLTR